MENQLSAGFWLSPQQKLLWSHQSANPAAVQRCACLVSIKGRIHVAALHKAVCDLVARHEVLRTVFRRTAGMRLPFQIVLEPHAPGWEVLSRDQVPAAARVTEMDSLLERELARSIDPEKPPVLHATLIEWGGDDSTLLLGVSAACADHSSLAILARELAQRYADPLAGASEPLRYVQYADWQNDLLKEESEDAREGREYWTAQRSPVAPEPRLPCEGPVDSVAAHPESVCGTLAPALIGQLNALAAAQGASTSEVLLTAWASLLARLSGQSSLMTGVELGGRGYEELDGAVGLFCKTVPIAVHLTGELRFGEALQQTHETLQRAGEWQEYFDPAESTLALQFSHVQLAGKERFGDVSFELLRQEVRSERFVLKLEVQESPGGMALRFHYDAARLSGEVVTRWAGYFQTLLGAALEDPQMPVSRLPLLGPAERQQLLLEWNHTAAEYPRQCLHTLFEAQAARTPERAAVRCGEQQLSYRQLNERANQLAHHLRGLGVGPNSPVGLAVERSAEMMVALLGILKAGGAYVPLNPDNPKPRLAQQLSGTAVLIAEQSLLGQLPEFPGHTLCLDRDQPLWADAPHTNPPLNTTPENLIYIIYTSGSTGTPKGVAVRHRNLVNYAHFITRRLQLERFPAGLHFATVSTIGADLGNTCLFPALLSGGCLHVIRYEDSTDSQRFARYAQQHPIDVLKIVPSHLQALLGASDGAQVLPRQYLILGGEALTPALLGKITALGVPCQILNHYGPTETTVGSLTLKLADYDGQANPAASIPIGRPIANTQVYILDAHHQPVPPGVSGELYIAGEGVTAGYLNQPEQTAERFLANPFSTDPAARMYRTGDLARYRPDGNVEFLGRGDDQVKIRGFRIELGEIESVLAGHPAVKQALVLAQEDAHGERRLVAYCVLQREPTASPEALREHLRQQLPEYMVPAAILPLAKIPLTANGKIDRQALPDPDTALAQTHVYVPPSTPTEQVVAGIWAEVLRRERISVTDNFFELGGHSLMATQVISRVRQHFQVELAMRIIFESPTVQGVSTAIEAASQLGEDADTAIVPVIRDAYRAN